MQTETNKKQKQVKLYKWSYALINSGNTCCSKTRTKTKIKQKQKGAKQKKQTKNKNK